MTSPGGSGIAPGVRVIITAGDAKGIRGTITELWSLAVKGWPALWRVKSEPSGQLRVIREDYLSVLS